MNEFVNFIWKDILAFLFIFVRIGVIFAMIPFFGAEIVPRRVTASIAFFLALVLMPVVPSVNVDTSNLKILTLVVLLLHDLLIGLCMGLAINIIFAGIQTAGEIIGFQMGFSIVNVVDPMTGVDAPITANMLYIVAFLLFLSFGGHHMLIRALVESFSIMPVQATLPKQGYLLSVISYGAQVFVIGVKVAAPVIGILLLVNIAFAITARAVPQMNVFIVSFPISIAIGFIFIIVIINLMPGFISSALGEAFTFIKMTMPLY